MRDLQSVISVLKTSRLVPIIAKSPAAYKNFAKAPPLRKFRKIKKF